MTEEARILAKAAWRLIPFMGLLYVVNFLDRVNVGFAALTMNRDIGLDAQAYGWGAGMFFIGYFFFEVPSNVIQERVGARFWVFRIMLTWGVISMATALARGPLSFYALRFLLGAAEAGFFPGMMLYLTYWFPPATRAQFNSLFLASILVANIFGSPISGFILGLGGARGLHGWQWLFILEGLPSCILAFAVLAWLPDNPSRADWLSDGEKKILAAAHARDEVASAGLRVGLLDPRVWILAAADFGIILALYGVGLWLPQIVKAMGFSNLETGFVVAMPYIAAMLAMIAWARSSDRRRERTLHIAIPALLAAASLIASALLGANLWAVITLTLATMGIYAALVVFWALPTSFLGGTAAAGGIALINAIANLGGFLGPYLMGWLKEKTGGYETGMAVLAVGLISAVLIVLALSRRIAALRPVVVLD
jgi:ACS family tartrate transporter-like MFS transporter